MDVQKYTLFSCTLNFTPSINNGRNFGDQECPVFRELPSSNDRKTFVFRSQIANISNGIKRFGEFIKNHDTRYWCVDSVIYMIWISIYYYNNILARSFNYSFCYENQNAQFLLDDNNKGDSSDRISSNRWIVQIVRGK